MTNKVAVSLPDDIFERLERVRRRRKLTRSAAVQLAVDDWLAKLEHERAINDYVEGYRRVPEKSGDTGGWAAAEAWSDYEEP